MAGRWDDLHVAGLRRAAGTSGISASFASNRIPERRDDPNASFNSREFPASKLVRQHPLRTPAAPLSTMRLNKTAQARRTEGSSKRLPRAQLPLPHWRGRSASQLLLRPRPARPPPNNASWLVATAQHRPELVAASRLRGMPRFRTSGSVILRRPDRQLSPRRSAAEPTRTEALSRPPNRRRGPSPAS